jgi:hypothetical protein
MKKSVILVVFLAIFHADLCRAVAINASQFNQTVSCGNPLVLDSSSLLFLDEDIIINQDCQLFELANSFSSTDTLTITSLEGFSIIITVDSDFGNLFFQGHQIILQGNAQLVIMPGVSIMSEDSVIVCEENARIQWL